MSKRQGFCLGVILWAGLSAVLPAQGIELGPTTEPLLFQRFLEALKTSEDLAAQREKVQASGLNSELKVRYLLRLSAVLEAQGNFSGALEVLEVLHARKRSPEATHRMGHLYWETGNFTDAQAAAHELSAAEDPYWRVRGAILQSRIWRGQGLTSAAEEILRKAATDMPGLPDRLYLWETALASGDSRREAVSALALRFFPQSPEAELLAQKSPGIIRAWGLLSWRSGSVPAVLSPGEGKETPAAAEATEEGDLFSRGEFLQVGAFKERINAEELKAKLPSSLRAGVILYEGLFRVWIPRTSSAEKELEKLKTAFILKRR